MRLARLKVRNIRSYAEGDLTLPTGTTLLVGDIGSGKTSLLYAIEMALFGFAEVDPTYLIRHHAPRAEVALTLVDAAHSYELRRRFHRRVVRGRESFQLESSAYSEDGVTRTYSATELRQRTIDLLGFPDNPNPRAHSDLWRWAVYIPQERMREVLEQSPTDRLETVRKALGLEQYRTAAENAQIVAAELGHRADRHESEAAGLRHHEAALQHWTEEAHRSAEEGRAARERVDHDRAELERSESRLHDLEQDRQRAESAAEEATELSSRAADLEEAIRRIEERAQAARASDESLRAEAADASELDRSVADATVAVDRLRQEQAETRRALDRLQAERARLEAAKALTSARRETVERREQEAREGRRTEEAREQELQALLAEGPAREPPAPTPRTLPEIAELVAAAQGEVDRRSGELARAELLFREIDELLHEGRCPRCHQAVRPSDFEPHRREAEQTRSDARQALDDSTAARQRLEEERRSRERYERALLSWTHAEERRGTARHQLGEAHARRESQEQSLETSRQELAAAEELARQLGPASAAFDEVAGKAASLERELEESSARRAALAGRRELIERGAAERLRLESELKRLDQEGRERRQELEKLRDRERTRRATAAELSRVRDDLERARAARAEVVRRLDQGNAEVGASARTETHAREEVRRASEGAEKARRLSEEARRARSLAQWLSHTFRESMVELEKRLLSRAQQEFERTFSRYFHALVDDPALVARCDTAFGPAVEINGEWTPAEALSGGERTALALAYRLTLGHVVRAFGQLTLETLILDEPTDGFSPEQVTRMGELLDELALPQVLLVSHESGLAAIADRVVRVRKEDGTSILAVDAGDPRPTEPSTLEPEPSDRRAPPRRRHRPRLEEAAVRPPAS